MDANMMMGLEAAIKANDSKGIMQCIADAVNEVLEYHRTHRPVNTQRAYTPKQKEWTVKSQPSSFALVLSPFGVN